MSLAIFAAMDRFQLAFWAAYRDYRIKGQRRGQARFNALATTSDWMPGEVRGEGCDPFYDDDLVPAFDRLVFGESVYRDNPGWAEL